MSLISQATETIDLLSIFDDVFFGRGSDFLAFSWAMAALLMIYFISIYTLISYPIPSIFRT